MILADDLPTLERQVARCRDEDSEKRGALKSTLKLLRTKYKVENIEQARVLYKKLLKREHTLADEAIAAKQAFEKRYKDKLNPPEKDDDN